VTFRRFGLTTPGWVRLHEKGGKVTELPCHHSLDQYLEEWLAVSGLGSEPEAPLFPTLRHGRLTGPHFPAPGQCAPDDSEACQSRRPETKISAHSFRATGITTYLQNGGKLEIAQHMAGHESARTTGLYDRRSDGLRSTRWSGLHTDVTLRL